MLLLIPKCYKYFIIFGIRRSMTKAKYTPEERKKIKAENLLKNIEAAKKRGYTQKSAAREEAIKEGKKTYIGSTACKKCGSYEKYVSNWSCAPCIKEKGLKKLNNKELMKPYRTKEKVNNKTYRYRTKKFGDAPILTNEEYEKILLFYKECARITEETGILHHVDHIHPISKGGKHHPDNLQILTAIENIRKGNKLL
jgi:hypothetical protein